VCDLLELWVFEVRVRQRAGFLLCLSIAATCSFADDNAGVLRAGFGGQVTVGSDGGVQVGEITGVSNALAQTVRSHLAAIHFVPGRRGDAFVATKVPLSGTLLLTPIANGQYEVRMEEVKVAPRLKDANPPRYPAGQMLAGKAGFAEITVRVGNNGSIIDTRTVSSSHRDFARAARDAMRTWRFEPLPSGMTEINVSVPFWYPLASKNPERPVFTCALATEIAHVEKQDGCMDLMVTVASYTDHR
jgi:TonB family protein